MLMNPNLIALCGVARARLLVCFTGLVLALSACDAKKEAVTPLGTAGAPVSVTNPTKTFDATGQKLLGSGTFENGVHPTTGSVKVYESGTTRTLVFDGFKTDGGPDLRIYLAEDAAVTNFIEVSKLTASGSFFVEIPAGYDSAKQRTVLIWCRQFSVLFGSAKLK
jgi:hypothetical protein